MELLSVWKDWKDYGCGWAYEYWKWNRHYIVHPSVIAQQVWQVTGCNQESVEHYEHIYGRRMNAHWQREILSTGTHGRLI